MHELIKRLCLFFSSHTDFSLKKVVENVFEVQFKRLDRQVRPGFEHGTSRLPVLSVITPLLVGIPGRT